MEIQFLDRKKKLFTWHPLWKNHLPKNLSMAERETLERIKKVLNIPDEFLETILTGDGEKGLRAKTFKALENGFKTYEYHLFSPLVWENEQLCYRTRERTTSTHPDVVDSHKTVLVSERELINRLHAIFNKKALNGETYDYRQK